MKYININGKLVTASEAFIPYDNRAFRYGYGLFETILFRNGNIDLKELHWYRLFSGLEKLHFNIPKLITPQYLEEEIIRSVQKNKLEKLCRVRLQVYAGSGGIYDTVNPKPEFIIECFEIDHGIINLNENGLITGIATDLKKSIDSLSNIKTTNALIYTIAAQQAKTNKWNDALICNTNGHIIESTIANIFWVKDQVIHTPPLSAGCIAGTMRSFIITSLLASGINIVEKDLSWHGLSSANEVFLTNAIRRIKWIYTIGNKTYENNYTKYINELLLF